MSMMMDLVWQDNGDIEFRSACADCRFTSGPFDDEDDARSAYVGHSCVVADGRVPA